MVPRTVAYKEDIQVKSSSSRMDLVSVLLTFSILLDFAVLSSTLKPGGLNVCSKQERNIRLVNKTQFYSETERRNRTVYQCCNGWKAVGEECTIACQSGRYGAGCNKECQCKNNATCHHVTGKCVCLPGWNGTYCEEPCSNNKFGRNCSLYCQCDQENTVLCDPVNGQCDCKAGWTGNYCTKECPSGFFGYNCKQKCECNCPCMPGVCSHVNGSCYRHLSVVESPDKKDFPDWIWVVIGSVCAVVGVVVLIVLCRRWNNRREPHLVPSPSSSSRLKPGDKDFCKHDGYPNAVQMTMIGTENLGNSEENVIPTNEVEKPDETYYANVNASRTDDENNHYENVRFQENVPTSKTNHLPADNFGSSQKPFEEDPSNTYEKLCRQPDEQCSIYQSLNKV